MEAMRLQMRDLESKLAELGKKAAAPSPMEAMRLQMRDLVMQASADGVMDDLCAKLEEAPVAEDVSKDEDLIEEELAKLMEETVVQTPDLVEEELAKLTD